MTPRPINSTLAAVLSLFAILSGAFAQDAIDQDADGLPDQFEQQLLERFGPVFFISAGDCDVMPAEFAPNSPEPSLVARNGTIYGQVFKKPTIAMPGRFIEIHYFHLWTRGCGRAGHPLDVEHVSVLLRADREDSPAADWSATYWYAGAHENTVCDVSSASRASDLGASDKGPPVWISNAKHASFLAQRQCALGCGGDHCENVIELKSQRIVNLGEAGAPLNGAIWITSRQWNLAAKMATDFDDQVLARLADSEAGEIVRLRERPAPALAVIRSGGSTLNSIEGSGRRADQAIEKSSATVDASLAHAAKSVRSSFGTAARFLRLKQK